MGDEVGDGDEVTGVCIDVGLVEGAVGVLGLDDVGEGYGAVFPDEVFEGGVLLILLGVELVLDGGEDFGPLERGSRGGDGGWREWWMWERDERRRGGEGKRRKRTTERKGALSETTEGGEEI